MEGKKVQEDFALKWRLDPPLNGKLGKATHTQCSQTYCQVHGSLPACLPGNTHKRIVDSKGACLPNASQGGRGSKGHALGHPVATTALHKDRRTI